MNDNFIQIFNTNQSKGQQWKGGVIKSSFNYLLIDPQISQDLPLRSQTLNTLKCFETFINSIFYIGKGKNARPYDHLHEALLRHNSKIIKVNY